MAVILVMDKNESNPRLVAWCKIVAGLAAVSAIMVGALVLVGWWRDVLVLKAVAPGWAAMKANTAAGFVLAGLALALLRTESPGSWLQRIGQALAGGVALLGLLTLVEHLGGWDLGIDDRLFPDDAVTAHPGRMALPTAFNFLCLGLALALLDRITWRDVWPTQFLILPILLLSFLVMIVYLYSAPGPDRSLPFATVALHTAVTFALLGVGVLCARPERGWMQGNRI